MTTRLLRPFAMLAAAATVTALTVSAFAAPVQAKPPVKPGPVTGLAMTLTKPADNFTVSATWTAGDQRHDVRRRAHQRDHGRRPGRQHRRRDHAGRPR